MANFARTFVPFDQHAVRQRTTSPQLTGQADANYARYEGGGPPPAITAMASLGG
jgi:hypothetical protein